MQVKSVRFSLRAFLAALVYIYIYIFWLNKKNEKNLAATLENLHMQCTDAQILTRESIEGKEMRN